MAYREVDMWEIREVLRQIGLARPRPHERSMPPSHSATRDEIIELPASHRSSPENPSSPSWKNLGKDRDTQRGQVPGESSEANSQPRRNPARPHPMHTRQGASAMRTATEP